MPKEGRPFTTNTHRRTPYPPVTTKMPNPTYSPTASGTDRHASQSWPPENDKRLMEARQQGMNWQPIATKYFPDKTANACRKRHERLMEKRNHTENWEGVKMETLAKAYNELREEMWKILADRVGEKWQTVEAKVLNSAMIQRFLNKELTRLDSVWKRASKPSPQLADPLFAVSKAASTAPFPAPTSTKIFPTIIRLNPTAPAPTTLTKTTPSTTAASAATILSTTMKTPTPLLLPLFPPSLPHIALTASPRRRRTHPQSPPHRIHLPLLFSKAPRCSSSIICLHLFPNSSSSRPYRVLVPRSVCRAFPVS